ncbi:MAG: YbdD/YjiX family protein [Microbacterium sp.]
MNQTDAAAVPHREGLWSLVVRAGRGIRWYMTTLMGDRAYDTYVAHLRARHPDATPVTERQFWRQRMADQDRNPGARCC